MICNLTDVFILIFVFIM